MPEKPETPKILDEISKSNSAKAKGTTSRQQQKARRRFVIVTMLFLPVLAGVLFLAFQQFQLQQQLAAFQQENQQLTLALAAQDSQLQGFQQQLEEPLQPVPVDDASVQALEAGFQALEENLNEEILSLRQQLADFQRQQPPANEIANTDWKVFEAEYLLGIANRKLQLEGDHVSAIELIENADSSLVDSGNSNVFATRQSIAGDLARLRSLEPLDREGIYLRLGILASEAEKINLLSSMRENFENQRNADSAPLEISSSSSGFVDSSLSFLGSVFVWREWDETPEAMLEPGQDAYIKQNLQIILEQAKLALLSTDKQLYQRSLSDASDWLHRYAVTDSVIGQSLLAELDELASMDIDPALPSLAESLALIRQLTANLQ
tara:strand:+ start:321 stop:1457 length:1137 start_codon:yes stop_codon:yes gene_type:complete